MIDYVALQKAIREMQRHQKIYKFLKAELSAQGHWKNKPRGTHKDK